MRRVDDRRNQFAVGLDARYRSTEFDEWFEARNGREFLAFDRVTLVAVHVEKRLASCLRVAIRQPEAAFGHGAVFVTAAQNENTSQEQGDSREPFHCCAPLQ